MVVENPHITTTDLRDVVYDYLVSGGWLDLLREAAEAPFDDPDRDSVDMTLNELVDDPDTALHELVDEHLDLIAFICNRFEPGTVISRSGTLVWSREWPTAA